MTAKKQTRGRLSSLDLLPDEAQDDLIWALSQLNERRRSQADILFELNDRLAVKGIDPISSSAFSRRAVRLAKRARQLEERRFVYAGLVEKLTPEDINKNDMILSEMIKTLIEDLLDEEGLNSKNVLELARAQKEAVMAQAHSNAARMKAQEEAKKQTLAAIDQIEKSLPEETGTTDGQALIRKIREEIYGIYEKPS